jgi:hypothetical protein
MMKAHFYGTTRTWAGGDRGEKLLLTQEDVLWVPEASGDLMSLGKLTRISFKALLHEIILGLTPYMYSYINIHISIQRSYREFSCMNPHLRVRRPRARK